METVLVCPSCSGEINLTSEEVHRLFDKNCRYFVLKDDLEQTPECPHCCINFDEMPNPRFKSAE